MEVKGIKFYSYGRYNIGLKRKYLIRANQDEIDLIPENEEIKIYIRELFHILRGAKELIDELKLSLRQKSNQNTSDKPTKILDDIDFLRHLIKKAIYPCLSHIRYHHIWKPRSKTSV